MDIQLLHQKLLVKPGSRWLLWGASENYQKTNLAVTHMSFHTVPNGQFDGIQIFVTHHQELLLCMKEIYPAIGSNTILWICYPKKSSGIASDLSIMHNWAALSAYRFQPVASASIDETWTALRFKPENQVKKSAGSKASIRDSEYAKYVDLDTRTVYPPEDFRILLEQNDAAYAFFKQLSYTNKKEYVLWILSAKQAKTRTERLTKTMDYLSAGKKNPTDK